MNSTIELHFDRVRVRTGVMETVYSLGKPRFAAEQIAMLQQRIAELEADLADREEANKLILGVRNAYEYRRVEVPTRVLERIGAVLAAKAAKEKP